MHGPVAHGPLASALCRCVLLLAPTSGGDAVQVRCGTWLVGSELGVGMSIFANLFAECCLDVCPVPESRASLLLRRVLPFVIGSLCWLFASATLVRRGSDVRSLFCFPANVRNAVLIAAKCPGLSLRSCAAVCDRSPYPLPASSPCPEGGSLVTLVTLVSHSQPLWRGVTQGGVAPVFPFRANP